MSSRSVDAEQQRRQAHANELMLAVAARLLGEARIAEAFPTGDAALGAFRTRLAPELADDEHIVLAGEDRLELPRSDYKLELEAEVDSVRLSCSYGSHGMSGRLRLDGAIVEGLYSVGVSFDDPAQRVELAPADAEAMAKAIAAMEEDETAGVEFRGEEFRRALAGSTAAGCPGSDPRGRALRRRPRGPLHLRLPGHGPGRDPAALLRDGRGRAPARQALGGSRGRGRDARTEPLGHRRRRHLLSPRGRQPRRIGGRPRRDPFTPAVPATATRLVVSSYAGTVEVDLWRP